MHTAGGTAQIGQGAMLESSVVVGKWGAERGGRGERMSLTGYVQQLSQLQCWDLMGYVPRPQWCRMRLLPSLERPRYGQVNVGC